MHCYQNTSRNQELSRTDAFDEVAALIPYLSDIIAGGGEPLVIPFWRNFLKDYRPEINPFLRFMTTTNATSIREDVLQHLKKFTRVCITVSVDGARENTFQAIRRGANFQTVLKNIEKLKSLHTYVDKFYLTANISIMKENFRELPEIIKLFSHLRMPFNYQPVLSYPVPQSLRCFANIEWEMRGWKDALDKTEQLLHETYFPAMNSLEERSGHSQWVEEERETYLNHLGVLRSLIPWEKLHQQHFRISGKLPGQFVKDVEMIYEIHNARSGDMKSPILRFFEYPMMTSAESFYYAAVNPDMSFEAFVPAGKYECILSSDQSAAHGSIISTSDSKLRIDVSENGEARLKGLDCIDVRL